MSCLHRFKEDLNIKYSSDWKPETLIVGTFNPEWSNNNSAKWFYGRTENNFFWSVLPQVYKEKSKLCETELEWKKFCEQKKIAITDLIECIITADYDKHKAIISGFSDKAIEDNFKAKEDFKLVKIIDILKSNPSIKHVYLTRSAKQGLWRRLWKPVKEYCDENTLTCEELLTPSGYAFYQFTKEQRKFFDSLSSFIVSKWTDKWHNINDTKINL